MWGISWLAAKPVSFSRRTLLHGVSSWSKSYSRADYWKFLHSFLGYRIFLNSSFVPILINLLPRITLLCYNISFPLFPFIALFVITASNQRYQRWPHRVPMDCSVSTLCLHPISWRGVFPFSHNAMCIFLSPTRLTVINPFDSWFRTYCTDKQQ